MRMRVTDSTDANFAKYPTGVRPFLLVYYLTRPEWVTVIPNPELGIFEGLDLIS